MAWLFSRSSDHCAVNLPQETGKLSVSYVFRHTSAPGSGFPNRHFILVRGADPLSQANYYIYHDSAKIVLGWTTASSTYQEVYGTWAADLLEHHCLIAVDWDNDTVQVYLDRVALAMTTTGITTTPQTTGTSMLIGLLQAGSSERFGGYLSKLALWQGVALGAFHASDLYRGASPSEVAPGYLSRYWKMNADYLGGIFEEVQHALATLTGPPKHAPGPQDAVDPLLRDAWWTRFVRAVAAGGVTYNQSVLASTQPASALLRQAGKIVRATDSALAALSRGIGKPLAASNEAVASLNQIRVFLAALAAATQPVAALARAIGKPLLAVDAALAALRRDTAKPLAAGTTPAAGIVKTTGKALLRSNAALAALTQIRVFLSAVLAATTPAAALARNVGKGIRADAQALAGLTRATARSLLAATTPAAGLARGTAKALRATNAALAALVATLLEAGGATVDRLIALLARRLLTRPLAASRHLTIALSASTAAGETGMAAEDQDFELFAGDDAVLEFTVTNEAGAAQSLAGASIAWLCARRAGATAVLTKSGAIVDPASGGVFRVTLADTDTDDLLGEYWHQAVVTDSSGNIVTVATGYLRAKARV